MMKKAFAVSGLTLALGGAAWADTPTGPGATGSGGTGLNAPYANIRADGPGGSVNVREDGMPIDRADANSQANARAPTPNAATGSTSGNAATGAAGSAGAFGSVNGVQIKPEAAIDP